MEDELVLYTNPWSRGRIARWMMEEVGAPYRTEIVAYGPEMKGADYLAINPMGKVPALKHGDTVITEVAAICLYMADAFPDAGLAPTPSSPDRGRYYRWMLFGAGPVEQATVNHALEFKVPEDKTQMAGYGSLDLVNRVLDQHLSAHQYVAGDSFTAADVYLGSHISWGIEFGTIEKTEALAAYAEKVVSRPAAIRAKEIDDALTPKDAPNE
ncbi:MAG: glutathione S-transferase family protein [Pseudomonadota bacterium]